MTDRVGKLVALHSSEGSMYRGNLAVQIAEGEIAAIERAGLTVVLIDDTMILRVAHAIGRAHSCSENTWSTVDVARAALAALTGGAT